MYLELFSLILIRALFKAEENESIILTMIVMLHDLLQNPVCVFYPPFICYMSCYSVILKPEVATITIIWTAIKLQPYSNNNYITPYVK